MLNNVQLARIDLNLLVLFDVVLQERNVGRAASQLGLSASAVSHGLGRLRRLFEDPLFLRTPKGVVPTERALALAPAIADILARVQGVVATTAPFDASRSTRRFVLGIPDSTAVVLLPALLSHTQRSAPSVDLGLRHIFPQSALTDLEARTIDLAVVALEEVPARFHSQPVYEESFVIAARLGHPFLGRPTLKRYCEGKHVLASTSGDAYGFVDIALKEKGLSRRVALVVSNFMLALAALEHSDLLTALPLSLALTHTARFGAGWAKAPVPLRRSELHVVGARAAMQDAGVAWLFETVVAATRSSGWSHGSGKRARAERRG